MKKTKKLFLTLVSIALVVCTIVSMSSISVCAYSLTTGKGISGRPLTIYAKSGLSSTYINALQSSISTWNNAGYGTFFTYGGTKTATNLNEQDGVSVLSTINLPGNTAFGVTTIWYNTSTKYIFEADISINTAYSYFVSLAGTGYDLISVMTHELGHALGLADCTDTEATMYGYMNPQETKKRTLATDDLNGLNALY